jgi:hypothetical protein
MTTINATTQIVIQSQDILSGTLTYSKDSLTSQTISVNNWPVTIENENTDTTIISVIFNTDIKIDSSFLGSGSSAYFICNSPYITFDGGNYSVTITTITNYPGLIQNGQDRTHSYSNITVRNITVDSTTSTLVSSDYGGGWICQKYFGNYIAGCIVENCSSNGPISNYGGGILGSRSFADVSGCYSTGEIGQLSGGIFGSNLLIPGSNLDGTNTCTVTNCYSTGKIKDQGGGIMGGQINAFFSASTHTGTNECIVSNCYSIGQINSFAGGIYGQYCNTYIYSGTNICKAINCYSTGHMNFNGSGGIYGDHCSYANTSGNNTCIAENCYSTGDISGVECGGIIGSYSLANNNSSTNTINIINCYSVGRITNLGCGGIYGASTLYYSLGGINTCSTVNCYSTGIMSGNSCGGIYGRQTMNRINDGINTCSTVNCYSTGNMSGNFCGGIYGQNTFLTITSGTNTCSTVNCYSIGIMSGNSCGGIYGKNTFIDITGGNNTSSAENCYSIGIMSGNSCGGIYGMETFTSITGGTNTSSATNCYSTGNMSSTSGGIYSTIINTGYGNAAATNCYTSGLNSNSRGIFADSTLDNPSISYYSGTNNYSEAGNSGTVGWRDTHANSLTNSGKGLTNVFSYGTIWISIYLNTPYLLLSYNTNFYNGDVTSDSAEVSVYTTLTTKYNPLTISPYPEDFEILLDSGINIDSSGNMMTNISGPHDFKILRGFKYTSPTPTPAIVTPSIITSPPGIYIGYNIINFSLNGTTPTPPTPPTPSPIAISPIVISPTPITYNINTKCKKNTTKKIKLLARSFISTKLKFYIKLNPEHGIVLLKNDKVYYTPNNDYVGRDKFTYYCKNSLNIKSNVSKVNIKVKEYSS